jgi:hypothetical protein
MSRVIEFGGPVCGARERSVGHARRSTITACRCRLRDKGHEPYRRTRSCDIMLLVNCSLRTFALRVWRSCPSKIEALGSCKVASCLSRKFAKVIVCRMFETFSFLPPLSDGEIARQVDYVIANGWTPCLEFADSSCAYAMDKSQMRFGNSASAVRPPYVSSVSVRVVLFIVGCDSMARACAPDIPGCSPARASGSLHPPMPVSSKQRHCRNTGFEGRTVA